MGRRGRADGVFSTGLVLPAVLLVGCSGPSEHAGPATPGPSSPRPTSSAGDGIRGQFDVGGGRHLFLECRGTGTPTIVLDAGGGDDHSTWSSEILDPLRAAARTCVYDRAGTGLSDAPPEHRRLMADVVDDLDALLAAARVSGPYLFVGTSFGGQVALATALRHTDETAGLVEIDSDWPSADPARDALHSVLTRAQWKVIAEGDSWDSPDNREGVAYQATLPETEKLVHRLPGVPVRVLTATRVDPSCPLLWDCALIQKRSIAFQKQWFRLGDGVSRRLVDSGHVMHHEVPRLVAEEVLATLAEARA